MWNCCVFLPKKMKRIEVVHVREQLIIEWLNLHENHRILNNKNGKRKFLHKLIDSEIWKVIISVCVYSFALKKIKSIIDVCALEMYFIHYYMEVCKCACGLNQIKPQYHNWYIHTESTCQQSTNFHAHNTIKSNAAHQSTP